MSFKKLQMRRGAKANLPTLSQGEFGFCTDTKELFIGNGSSNEKIANINDVNKVSSQTSKPKKSFNVTIPLSGWSSSAPYTQTVNVSGMVSDGLPLYDLQAYSKSALAELSKITKLETQNGKIVVTAQEKKPGANLNIRIEVMY